MKLSDGFDVVEFVFTFVLEAFGVFFIFDIGIVLLGDDFLCRDVHSGEDTAPDLAIEFFLVVFGEVFAFTEVIDGIEDGGLSDVEGGNLGVFVPGLEEGLDALPFMVLEFAAEPGADESGRVGVFQVAEFFHQAIHVGDVIFLEEADLVGRVDRIAERIGESVTEEIRVDVIGHGNTYLDT
jgi:hypothetical protein